MQAIKLTIYHNDIISLQKLLNKGDLTSRELSIIFIYSVVCNKTEIVKLLIDQGANYNFMDNYALRVACCNGYYDICKMLLSKKYNTKITNEYAFLVACSNGHLEVAKLLVKYGANIKTCNDQAFIWAYCNGHKNIINYLIECGLDISLVEKVNMGQYRYVSKFENDDENIYNIIQVFYNNTLIDTKKIICFADSY
ncbi:repeat protein [Moumouvirus goulette]|uniref:Repeat protein n=1 Tax=Moumouvirus goulette TaxID=1247379 RepID=M1PHF2_9VIRU|nr:repeat protein [Moumouvirus goulette]AGF85508.1 repeat protein [Moumouvirus goulette]